MQHDVEPPRVKRLFAAGCAGMFVFGVVLALLGTLFGLPEMRARMHVDLAQQGNLFFLLFLGVCSSTLAAGPLIDNLGHKLILLWSSLLVAGGLLGFVLAFAPECGESSIEPGQSCGERSFIREPVGAVPVAGRSIIRCVTHPIDTRNRQTTRRKRPCTPQKPRGPYLGHLPKSRMREPALSN